ncbi:hydrolase [Spirochaetia bacterium]|nr:hydrolase [Spirochaetia bacterium]
MKYYQSDYPRPQFVRRAGSWVNLNGPWDFAFDDEKEGIANRWFDAFPRGPKIKVPFTYETPAGGIGDPLRHDTVWYHRILTIDPEQVRGKRLVLHFEGSDYRTGLWVNGAFAGSHEGGYARFSFDITHLAKAGENTIVVRVEDSFDITRSRGKQRWKDENFGCWYIQTTGLWKTVWLEFVGEEHIKSVKMTPVFSEGKLEIEAEISAGGMDGGASFDGSLELEAAITYKDIPVTKITVAAGQKRIRISADVASTAVSEWGLLAWAPEHPHLYDISFTLIRQGKPVDEVFSYFGMREIRVDGDKVLLNGTPLYQRLILDQGYWKDSHLTPPDEQALITDIDRIMAAGYNGVRKHQKTEDERFLYWADVKGLLVWSEMAAAYEYNDEGVSNFTREWMEIVRQNYNHPAIITWTPFNESWGVPQIKTDAAQQHFTQAIYYLTKSFDRYRPVIVNDGWEHTISDIITLHDYEEQGEDFLDRYGEHLEEILDNRIYHSLSKSAFADSFVYRGQPIIISEFGGIAFNNDHSGWGYGNKVADKEAFIRRFDAITTAIKRIGAICGYCYTQVTDVQQEINGLMDMDRNFKVEPEILKEINERKVSNFYRIHRG